MRLRVSCYKPQLLKAQLVAISKEDLPTNPAEREQYFMEQVAMGEGLGQAGE